MSHAFYLRSLFSIPVGCSGLEVLRSLKGTCMVMGHVHRPLDVPTLGKAKHGAGREVDRVEREHKFENI